MSQLSNIEASIREVEDLLEAIEDGETTSYSALAARLDSLKEQSAEQVDRWASFFSVLSHRVKLLKAERQELTEAIRKIEATYDAAAEYLIYLNDRELIPSKLKGNIKSISIQDSPLKVEAVESEEFLEELYATNPELVNRKTVYELKRSEALERHKAGEALPYGIDVVRSKHLRIRTLGAKG